MTRLVHRGPDGDALDGLARVIVAVVIFAVVLVPLPGLMLGVAIALGLRAGRLRWTFAALAMVVLTLPLALRPVACAEAIAAISSDLSVGHAVGIDRAASGLWPFWLMIAGVVAVAVKRWLDRRVRLHGGHGELSYPPTVGESRTVLVHNRITIVGGRRLGRCLARSTRRLCGSR